ncbi:hypothetical protein L7F22_040748 [Adiantum nelumboides]|nr:hypothetical protein [Adiantum nelumboides]
MHEFLCTAHPSLNSALVQAFIKNSLCSWPDAMRFRYKWSSALHFIDTPDFSCNFNYNHNLTEALLFLAHIVGDIHQIEIRRRKGFTSDLGGNTIEVHWYLRVFNLHHIWDDEIIATANERFYNDSINSFVEDIGRNITEGHWNEEIIKWANCPNDGLACPDTYASEGISLACKWAYRNATPGAYLADDYFLTRMPIVKMRLAQGGVRLAAILNRIFGQDQVHELISVILRSLAR